MPVSLEDLKLFREVALAAYDLALYLTEHGDPNQRAVYTRDGEKAIEAITRINTLLED